MGDEKIELNNSEFKEIYENLGSKTFQLQGRVLEDLATNQLDVYFKSIGFATTVVGSIGLIAGFGFTALNHIQSNTFFFLGEALLIGGLFKGIFWTQKIYKQEFNGIEDERKKYITFYDERNTKFIELYNQWLIDKKIFKNTLRELYEIDKRSIDIYRTEKNRVTPSVYSWGMYALLISGTTVLLFSFFIKDFLNFLFYFCH